MVNLGQKKRTGTLGIGANVTNTKPQRTIENIAKFRIMTQQIIPTTCNRPIKIHWGSIGYLLKAILWTKTFFAWTHPWKKIITLHPLKMEKNPHTNVIHCKEVKHSTSDYSEELKYYGSCINTMIVPVRFQNIQRDQYSPQRQWPWDGLYIAQWNIRQLYHTSGNILSIVDTNF